MIRIVNASQFKRKDISVQAKDVSDTVAKIIEAVKTKGDSAVISYEKKFDGVKLSALEVSADENDEALNAVGDEYIAML